ncbi:archaellin/type IV pilin N-terminal domain-containing protein [Methanoregula formicica]|uniref:Flagellin n=1 Tax=Methanoregula formicica (strain DSM 22288 / NBRC 105244 / SMSP) TaxID=593750 RepID=L0HFG7_METFS|nr:archaellin/type IV pilin N-terminal domain-containing protein [Methanoregula formicica]AGB02541.1 archaeal flagellin [Methanoregula formicica SMSP]
MVKTMKNLYSEDAFTGLEAAIVLIAFVVVAAVFSYVVLGAGFFTTQTAQATVHTGVAQASSSLEIVGNVMGIAVDPASNRLTFINTSVALTAGGTAMDLTQMVISYSDSKGGRIASIPNATAGIAECEADTILSANHDAADNRWCVSQKINDLGTNNNLLEPNEIWVLSIGMPPTAQINQKITVNMQPAVGAVLPITRTIPGGLNYVQAIY